MQKQILLAFVLALTGISAAAKIVVITCTLNPDVYQSQFDATATLDIDKDNNVSGIVAYSTLLNHAADLVSQPAVKVTGKMVVTAAGDLYINEIDTYSLTNGSDPFVTFELNAGAKDAFSSRALIHSQDSYVSSCSSQP